MMNNQQQNNQEEEWWEDKLQLIVFKYNAGNALYEELPDLIKSIVQHIRQEKDAEFVVDLTKLIYNKDEFVDFIDYAEIRELITKYKG